MHETLSSSPEFNWWAPIRPFNRVETLWFMWVFFQLINVVVLINFLITYISEAYEEVVSQDLIDEFSCKAELNLTSALHLKPFKFLRHVRLPFFILLPFH